MRLVALLPPPVAAALASRPDLDAVIEVVMDLGRQPLARLPGPVGDVPLSPLPVTREDLDAACASVGDFGDDNRAGVDRTLHRVSALRNRDGRVVGLTCRVGRAVRGSADAAADLVSGCSSSSSKSSSSSSSSKKRSPASVLLLGRPGVGKTTAIREIARLLADDFGRRVVVVDTSNEIAGDGDVPHPSLGSARRLMVSATALQHRVMVEAVENHMPECVVIDEVGTEAEALACRTIAQRGVQLVATAHGGSLASLIKNPALADLIGGVECVTLGDDEARRRSGQASGGRKTALERASPPTFDAAVEMLEPGVWRVHADLAASVDAALWAAARCTARDTRSIPGAPSSGGAGPGGTPSNVSTSAVMSSVRVSCLSQRRYDSTTRSRAATWGSLDAATCRRVREGGSRGLGRGSSQGRPKSRAARRGWWAAAGAGARARPSLQHPPDTPLAPTSLTRSTASWLRMNSHTPSEARMRKRSPAVSTRTRTSGSGMTPIFSAAESPIERVNAVPGYRACCIHRRGGSLESSSSLCQHGTVGSLRPSIWGRRGGRGGGSVWRGAARSGGEAGPAPPANPPSPLRPPPPTPPHPPTALPDPGS